MALGAISRRTASILVPMHRFWSTTLRRLPKVPVRLSPSTRARMFSSIPQAKASKPEKQGISRVEDCRACDPTSTSREQISEFQQLRSLRQPGFSMPQQFYTSPSLYNLELETTWRNSWLFAGFSYEIPNKGDYFTYEIGRDSIILIRGDDGKINALHNTCRHRGSRILAANSSGKVRRLVCPYHQWSYGRDGALLHVREMGKGFDMKQNGLLRVHLRDIHGMLFICLSDRDQPFFDFEPARNLIGPQIAPQQLENAKTAHAAVYTIKVYENNRECYHCNATHPEYIKSNYDITFTYQTDPATGAVTRALDPDHPRKEEIMAHMAERTAHWKQLGFECTPDNNFPGEGWYRATRQPLKKGWVTESLDGQPVSRRMGALPEADMGSLRIHTLPNFWIHASSDHAVAARLTPLSVNSTEAKVYWIVHKDAQEGQDYTLDKLLPLWQKTSEQDWELCVNNQLGVESSGYRPGVLSDRKEQGLEKFLHWYLSSTSRMLGL